MTTKSKRKGTAWETNLVNYLRDRFAVAERLTLRGTKDEGDLWFPHAGVPFVVEAKAERSINLAAYVTEAKAEAKNWHEARPEWPEPYGIAIVKRRNHGTGKSYVVMELDEFIRLVKRR